MNRRHAKRPKRRRPAAPGAQRSGFVLLVVLATLIVAGVTLAALATASLERALDAQAAQEELQQRWGTICCEQILLPRASELFEQSDKMRDSGIAAGTPAGVIRDQINLGGQRFDLILADEDAKANLNALYHEARQRHVEQTLQRLTGPAGQRIARLSARTPSAAALRRRLPRGADEQDEDDLVLPPAYLTWGDVFDVERLRQASGDDRMLATLAGRVTLWGSGRLNVDRAADDVVLAVCGAVIPDGLARRLLDRYRDRPEADLRLVAEKEIENGEDRSRLLELVGQGSSSFSLWTEVSSRRFRRQKFSVLQTDPEGQRKTFEFAL